MANVRVVSAAMLVAIGTGLTACTWLLGYGDEPHLAASTDDAAPVADTSSRDAGTDGPASFCDGLKPKPTFCADFDQPDPLAVWDSKSEAGGTVGLDTQHVVSSPSALALVTTGPPPNPPEDSVGVTKFFADLTPPATLEVSFSVWIDTADGIYTVIAYPLLAYANDNPSYILQLVVRADPDAGVVHFTLLDIDQLGDGGPAPPDPGLSAAYSMRTWIRVRMLLDLGTTDKRARLFINDASTPASDVVGMRSPSTPFVPRTMLLLTGRKEPEAIWHVSYDNATVDIR